MMTIKEYVEKIETVVSKQFELDVRDREENV